MAAKKKAQPMDEVRDLVERILGTRSVLNLQLDDVGVVIGDRKFAFSGKLTVGPLSVGKRTKG